MNLERELLSWLLHLDELALGTNFIMNNNCLRFGQLLWPSLRRKVKTSTGGVNL